ncbi:MAG: sterol desaturase/sphingolipid hydroxylase (fatty acid hydroxylase superfamily) [Crocinitomix sp.]|jgi:sterol desaturase/sphingolipid hydroxylase (fatty acid hydroxylase superfamily)
MEIITDVWDNIVQGLLEPLYYFNNPEKRINYFYLISSLLLAYYVYHKAKEKIPFYKYIFSKKIWLSKSAFIDYKYFFFNGIIKIVLIAPIIEAWWYMGVTINDWMEESFGISKALLTDSELITYYTLTLVVLSDLVIFLVHLVMHKIPFLWEFHKIHHSATTLNPITQYRLHPVELIINNLSLILLSSFLFGFFDYYYAGSVKAATYLEINIFALLFLFWGSSLRHSHVKLKYFHFLERFLISPFQHQLHHSNNPLHYDKNMGSQLAIWDWIFGTLVRSAEVAKIRFGLGKKEDENYNSFSKTLYMPFKNIARRIIGKNKESK